MPGMTGYEVAERLRASTEFAKTTLVAFSGYGQSADRRIAQDSGFDFHLVKPATVEQIENILSKAQIR
jgi:CheY-like chemotaxis protein